MILSIIAFITLPEFCIYLSVLVPHSTVNFLTRNQGFSTCIGHRQISVFPAEWMKLVICFSRCIWGCLPSSWPPFLSLLCIMVVSPGSCVCNTQLCSFVLVIGTEVDTSPHLNSSYFLSRKLRIDTERQQPVSASHLNLRAIKHPSLAMVCKKIWSKEEDELISYGYRHERM